MTVSAEPPQILVCVNERAASWGLIRNSGCFAVNFLAAEHLNFAQAFAKSGEKAEHFDSPRWKILESGAPVLVDAVAALDCVLESQQPVGTHLILVGRVIDITLGEGDPLLYRAGGFGKYRAD